MLCEMTRIKLDKWLTAFHWQTNKRHEQLLFRGITRIIYKREDVLDTQIPCSLFSLSILIYYLINAA